MPAPPPPFPGPPGLARLSQRTAMVALTAFVVIGLVPRLGHDWVAGVVGALVALAAGAPMLVGRPRFLARPGLVLVEAAVVVAGVAVVGNGNSRNLGWFAILVVAAWCVLAGGARTGLPCWAGSSLVFGGEWLWASRDPGWAPWTAGVTVMALAAAVVRHQFVLVEQLRSAQADLAQRSRAEERNRIARELHDVIAHGLAVSLLHVSSARVALEHDPADASRSLAEAERVTRRSLAEVRATVGLTKPATGPGIAPPVPGLGQLPHLVAELRGAGADVGLAVSGDAGAVPATVGTTAYRIVQEALTNATKHAPGSLVTVTIAVGGRSAEVNVDSSGPPGHGSGMGLGNMRERAVAVGGTCDAGPHGRGWRVHAALPLSPPPGPAWP